VSRLFVAAWPPADVVDALRGVVVPDEPNVRWVPPEQWHVTLRFLGDADPADVADALRGATLPAAEAELGPHVSRLGRFVVVVPVAGLDDLAAAVTAATASLGDPPDPRGFTGHLTIARLRRRGACRVTGTPARHRFPVREVALVSSVTTAGGAAYDVLDRFPLR
jgi:2'-5' RNA ligase